MKLYYFETPNPRKPCAVARYLDAPLEYVRIDLAAGENKTPAYLAINPNGKVPALSDGDFNLFESHAIMIYLARQAGSSLWPDDPRSQIEALQWLQWDAAHFSRHGGTLLFENHIKAVFGMGQPDADAIAEADGFFRHFAGVLDAHLKSRDYLLGEALSVADFGVAAMLPSAEEARLPLSGFGNVLRWHDRMLALPAWREPFPRAA